MMKGRQVGREEEGRTREREREDETEEGWARGRKCARGRTGYLTPLSTHIPSTSTVAASPLSSSSIFRTI